MNYDLEALPTFSEDGTVVTLIISSPEGKPISNGELREFLRDLSDVLGYENETPIKQ